ncbi:MAG: ribosome small subunit-dependent GTPase A [Thermoleophilia bacterium]
MRWRGGRGCDRWRNQIAEIPADPGRSLTREVEARLTALGWGEPFRSAWAAYEGEGDRVGRVTAEFRGGYVVGTGEGELEAVMCGRLRFASARGEASRPAVGDWVVLGSASGRQRAPVYHVLPRKTRLARKAAGDRATEQVIAANVDLVFVVSSLDRDLNLRRLERYLTVVRESGAAPVIVLSKADLCSAPAAAAGAVETAAPGVPAHVVSAVTQVGLADLERHLEPGRTVALLGSSGVGKSTLINHWLGYEKQAVGPMRAIGKGRHTTTHRELVALPGGALVIDTPGMREIGLLAEDAQGLAEAFPDVVALATGCRFRDCTHDCEPDCAVRAAVDRGALPRERLESFRKLHREVALAEARRREGQRARARGGRAGATRRTRR